MSNLANKPGQGNDLGYFIDLTALQAAYPTANAGDFAVLGSTDTIWIWDDLTNSWVNSGNNGSAFVKLDQSTKQDVINNSPNFKGGLTAWDNLNLNSTANGDYNFFNVSSGTGSLRLDNPTNYQNILNVNTGNFQYDGLNVVMGNYNTNYVPFWSQSSDNQSGTCYNYLNSSILFFDTGLDYQAQPLNFFGIGTTYPTSTLEINGTLSAGAYNNQFQMYNAGATMFGYYNSDYAQSNHIAGNSNYVSQILQISAVSQTEYTYTITDAFNIVVVGQDLTTIITSGMQLAFAYMGTWVYSGVINSSLSGSDTLINLNTGIPTINTTLQFRKLQLDAYISGNYDRYFPNSYSWEMYSSSSGNGKRSFLGYNNLVTSSYDSVTNTTYLYFQGDIPYLSIYAIPGSNFASYNAIFGNNNNVFKGGNNNIFGSGNTVNLSDPMYQYYQSAYNNIFGQGNVVNSTYSNFFGQSTYANRCSSITDFGNGNNINDCSNITNNANSATLARIGGGTILTGGASVTVQDQMYPFMVAQGAVMKAGDITHTPYSNVMMGGGGTMVSTMGYNFSQGGGQNTYNGGGSWNVGNGSYQLGNYSYQFGNGNTNYSDSNYILGANIINGSLAGGNTGFVDNCTWGATGSSGAYTSIYIPSDVTAYFNGGSTKVLINAANPGRYIESTGSSGVYRGWVTLALVNGDSGSGGSGYAVGDYGMIVGGNNNASYEVTAESGGVVTGIIVLTRGSGYTNGLKQATTTVVGGGSGLLVDMAIDAGTDVQLSDSIPSIAPDISYTPANLYGINNPGTGLANWNTITDGSFSITRGVGLYSWSGMDFSSATSIAVHPNGDPSVYSLLQGYLNTSGILVIYGGANQKNRIVLNGLATSGQIGFSFNSINRTITYNATTNDLQTIFDQMAGAGNTYVTGNCNITGQIEVTFIGALASQNAGNVYFDVSGLYNGSSPLVDTLTGLSSGDMFTMTSGIDGRWQLQYQDYTIGDNNFLSYGTYYAGGGTDISGESGTFICLGINIQNSGFGVNDAYLVEGQASGLAYMPDKQANSWLFGAGYTNLLPNTMQWHIGNTTGLTLQYSGSYHGAFGTALNNNYTFDFGGDINAHRYFAGDTAPVADGTYADVTTKGGIVTAGTNISYYSLTPSNSLQLNTAASQAGRMFWVKQVGAGTLTIMRNGSDTIEGVGANYTLVYDKAAVLLRSDGVSNWEILSYFNGTTP